jgi:DNA repair protein RadA/Sms
MPKSKSVYICNECGAESSQWFGKCSACGTYNSLEEEIVAPTAPSILVEGVGNPIPALIKSSTKGPAQPRSSLKFSEISNNVQMRFASGYVELDRVLGGGIVPGSLVLIGGDPGIGKSTLLLQVANQLAQTPYPLCLCRRVGTTGKAASISPGCWWSAD